MHISYGINYRCYLKIDTNEDIQQRKSIKDLLKKLMVNQLESFEDWIY